MATLEETLEKIPNLSNQVKNNIVNKTKLQDDGCWLYGDENNYVRIYYENRIESLSRLILGLDRDSPLNALHIRSCRNRNCINPEHLYAGDQRENTFDSIMVGTFSRHEKQKTHCLYGHEYTPENTIWQGNKRKCRECKRLSRNPFGKRKMPEGIYYSSAKIKK